MKRLIAAVTAIAIWFFSGLGTIVLQKWVGPSIPGPSVKSENEKKSEISFIDTDEFIDDEADVSYMSNKDILSGNIQDKQTDNLAQILAQHEETKKRDTFMKWQIRAVNEFKNASGYLHRIKNISEDTVNISMDSNSFDRIFAKVFIVPDLEEQFISSKQFLKDSLNIVDVVIRFDIPLSMYSDSLNDSVEDIETLRELFDESIRLIFLKEESDDLY
ncbi:MAG: hypothetical protein AB8F78_05080 [Saprospiraceae bacterium]